MPKKTVKKLSYFFLSFQSLKLYLYSKEFEFLMKIFGFKANINKVSTLQVFSI